MKIMILLSLCTLSITNIAMDRDALQARLSQSISDTITRQQQSIAAHAAHVSLHPAPGQRINTVFLDEHLEAAGVSDLERMSKIMSATNYNNSLDQE